MDTIIILDFGSQYTQLIARKIRELNIYCEIHPFNKIPTLTSDVKGVVFSGSPYWQYATEHNTWPNGEAGKCNVPPHENTAAPTCST